MFKKAKVVIINGLSGCGKDTFVNFCKEFCNVDNLSVADNAKKAMQILGWNGEKTPKNRRLLEYLVTFADINFDGNYKYIKENIEAINKRNLTDIIFIHSREPENIERFKKTFKAVSLLIERLDYEPVTKTYTDKRVYHHKYDYIINNINLEQLKEEAKKFVNNILKGEVKRCRNL
jgi:RNase adaptor protein for sRNA GlmZ degradation